MCRAHSEESEAKGRPHFPVMAVLYRRMSHVGRREKVLMASEGRFYIKGEIRRIWCRAFT